MKSGTEYPKIYSPWKRHTEGENKGRFNFMDWSEPEFALTAGLHWVWTEKIDGTNVRIIWDGHKVRIGGRTDDAQMPTFLLDLLNATFPEELLEQTFKDKQVVLYGEGFGPKIQKGGGLYGDKPMFALFDVRVGGTWLLPDDVRQVAGDMGLMNAPLVAVAPISGAAEIVSKGLTSAFGDFHAEGVVGTVIGGLQTRRGARIQVKLKHRDLFGLQV